MSDDQKKDIPESGVALEAEGTAAPKSGTESDPAAAKSTEAATTSAAVPPAEAAPLDAEQEAKAKADAEAREARAIARALRKGTPLPTPSAEASSAAAPSAEAPIADGSSAGAPPAEAAPLTEEQQAKAKADAEAREARAIARALRKGTPLPTPSAEASSAAAPSAEVPSAASPDAEAEAKAKAAAEARAARAAARGKKPEGEDDGTPKVPSPLQPRLDHLVKLIKEQVGETAIEEAFINERDAHLPYIVVKNEHWASVAQLLKQHCELKLNYLRNVSGIDQETHMEVAYHLLALDTKYEVCVKVKTSREAPSIASVTLIWPTANWNEREIFDLLGIDFPGHPDLRRIMMSDDWVGHPLRKDYEALDPEV